MKRSILNKHQGLIAVTVIAIVFSLATSSFNYLTQTPGFTKWSSPDETANYVFTVEYSQYGKLSFFDPANVIANNVVIPRSVRSDQGWLKPVSFLGIILIYGTIASWLGVAIIPFLTPIFAGLGIIIFYLIIKRFFSDRIALWSSVLLAAFPVYIYYTVRSMFHNVLFIVLAMASAYLALLAAGKHSSENKKPFFTYSLPAKTWLELIASFVSGLLAGLAVITRASELLWIIPSLLVIYIFYAKRLGLTKPILFLSGLAMACLPAAYHNQVLYGYFWYGGYNAMNSSLRNIIDSGGGLWQSTWAGQFQHYKQYAVNIFKSVFYFGFNPTRSLSAFKHYVILMFPWFFYGGLAGILLFMGGHLKSFKKKYWLYFLVWLILSLILVFYYGSWKFNDNPNAGAFTIGNSYTRYWLPLYMGLIPWLALLITRLGKALERACKVNKNWRRIISLGWQLVGVFIVASTSILFVLFGSSEGLVYLFNNSRLEKTQTTMVWSLTPANSVIVTRYDDKYLWPQRRVIVGNISDRFVWKAAAQLSPYYPVFYYNFVLRPQDLSYLNTRKLPPYNLHISLVRQISPGFALYSLKRISNYENIAKN